MYCPNQIKIQKYIRKVLQRNGSLTALNNFTLRRKHYTGITYFLFSFSYEITHISTLHKLKQKH